MLSITGQGVSAGASTVTTFRLSDGFEKLIRTTPCPCSDLTRLITSSVFVSGRAAILASMPPDLVVDAVPCVDCLATPCFSRISTTCRITSDFCVSGDSSMMGIRRAGFVGSADELAFCVELVFFDVVVTREFGTGCAGSLAATGVAGVVALETAGASAGAAAGCPGGVWASPTEVVAATAAIQKQSWRYLIMMTTFLSGVMECPLEIQ